jgi:hypothetical protein
VIDPIYGPGVASLVIDPATDGLLGALGKAARWLLPHSHFHSFPFFRLLPLSHHRPHFLPSTLFHSLKIHFLELVALHGRFAFFVVAPCLVQFVHSFPLPPAWRVFCKNDCCRVLFVTNQSDPAEPNLIHKPTGSTSFFKPTPLSRLASGPTTTTCAPLHLKLAFPITFLYDILCSHLRHRRRLPSNPTPAPIVPANSFFVPALDCIALHSSRLSNQPRDLSNTQGRYIASPLRTPR